MMLDPLLRHAVALAFPGAPVSDLRQTTGGFSHRSAIVTIGWERCVVKWAEQPGRRDDLRREAAVLDAIGGSLPVPHLIALVDDERVTATIARFVPGAHGIAWYSDSPIRLIRACEDLGTTLRRVHRSGYESAYEPLPPRFSRAAVALGELAIDDGERRVLADALAHPAWRGDAGLVHGDAGLHNTLWWNSQLSALLDWEWAGWGPPLLDIAWVSWTLRFRDAPAAARDALLRGYGNLPPAAAGWERALVFGQIAALLLRSQRSADATAEWTRRLRWTIESDGAP